MNIISIHASHDGSITIVKDNKFYVHAQIDRFNNIVANALPPLKLLIQIKKLNIKFDLVLISWLTDSCHWYWQEQLLKFDLLKPDYKTLYYEDKNHHYFHMSCAKATVGGNKNVVVIDGHGSIVGNSRSVSPMNEKNFHEQESIFKGNKKIYHSRKNIGNDYELKTKEVFNLNHLAFRSCGKLMALAAHKKEIGLFQKEIEEKIKRMMPSKDVTYTGGVAQNVLANSQFLDYNNFKIDPLCTDQGISLGVMNHHLKNNINLHDNPVYLGFEPEYSLESFQTTNITPQEVCKLLRKEPVGIFQGRSEQGQRGLGNRSLLMDATHKDAVDLVNKIKKREWFRPFAPAVLEEYASEYFDIRDNSPYMLYVFKAKKKIKSVCSIDGTSRIQTVSQKNNKHFYNLLKTFNEMYKIPLLLNTSLNLAGHTLVEDLEDLFYMMKYGNLKYCYLPEVNKIVSL
jgi:predicted NodU family carbamoyl transferase